MELTENEQILLKYKDLSTIKTARILSELLNHTQTITEYKDRAEQIAHKGTNKEIILRLHVKESIQKSLGITDSHTINSHIDKLISYDYLIKNPHTSLSAIKEVYKPSPETRYYTNTDKIYALFDEIRAIISKYYATHPHTKQTDLSYNQTNASESKIVNDIREN